jgi:hypothetical protein
MMPDASQWRSAARYEPVERMSASGLAWEWLRRNEAYNRDFDELSAKDADIPMLTDAIRQRWRLRFRGRPSTRSGRYHRFLDATGRHQYRRGCRRAF